MIYSRSFHLAQHQWWECIAEQSVHLIFMSMKLYEFLNNEFCMHLLCGNLESPTWTKAKFQLPNLLLFPSMLCFTWNTHGSRKFFSKSKCIFFKNSVQLSIMFNMPGSAQMSYCCNWKVKNKPRKNIGSHVLVSFRYWKRMWSKDNSWHKPASSSHCTLMRYSPGKSNLLPNILYW